MLPSSVAAATSKSSDHRHTGFTLWQLPSQVNTIGNSYVLRTEQGRVIVMDGGMPQEEFYLRGFLSALGANVDAWFISHPHDDHMGALCQILKKPGDLKINKIYHSRFSEELMMCEEGSDIPAREFYSLLDNAPCEVVNLTQPGLQLDLDGTNIKVLGVTNEEFHNNSYNNSSCILRVWDRHKSIIFLGDAGVECGNKVLNGPYRDELKCDYLQMAHHGQSGCNETFYKSVQFHACLWPTPSWVWENNQGKGYNTGTLTTFETRRWTDELGIKEHHVSWMGLYKME